MKNIDSIVERNLPLVPLIIKRMGLQERYEDYVDVGWIGLVRGCWAYEPESGYAESTYLCTCIYNEICNEIKHENRLKRKDYDIPKVYLDSLNFDDDDMSVYNTISDSFDIDSEFNYRYIKQAIEDTIKYDMGKRFKKVDHRIIVRHIFGFGEQQMKYDDISKQFGISKAMIKNIKNKFKEKLLKRLEFILD